MFSGELGMQDKFILVGLSSATLTYALGKILWHKWLGTWITHLTTL